MNTVAVPFETNVSIEKALNLFADEAKNEKGFFVEGYAITSDEDREGDIITLNAIQDAADSINIGDSVFYNHDTEGEPIGRIVDKKVIPTGNDTGKLWVRIFISSAEPTIQTKIKENVINKLSVTGVAPEDAIEDVVVDGEVVAHKVHSLKVFEVSLVGCPANPNAKTIGYEIKKNFELKFKKESDMKEEKIEKKITRGIKTPKSDQMDWDATKAEASVRKWASSDGSGDKDKIDWKKYAKAFVYYDEKNPNNFGSYKLIHHQVENGTLKVVWKGVAAALAALNGARGGVDIPASERKAAWNHLKVHYDQFGRAIPALKSLDFENITNDDQVKIEKALLKNSEPIIALYNDDIENALGKLDEFKLDDEINLLIKAKVTERAESRRDIGDSEKTFSILGLKVIEVSKFDPNILTKKDEGIEKAIVPNDESDKEKIIIDDESEDEKKNKDLEQQKTSSDTKKPEDDESKKEPEIEIKKKFEELEQKNKELQKKLEEKTLKEEELKQKIFKDLRVINTRKGLILRANNDEKLINKSEIEKEEIDIENADPNEIINDKELFESLDENTKKRLVAKSILKLIKNK